MFNLYRKFVNVSPLLLVTITTGLFYIHYHGDISRRTSSYTGTQEYTTTDQIVTSKDQAKAVRVLVWVLTGPQHLDSRAVHIKKTWGRRCDILLFFSSVDNETFPAIGTNTSEGRHHLTAKSVFAWNYIYKHYFNDADWFMKADDNSFVIVENLRHFLSTKQTDEEIFFGHHFQVGNRKGFFSGGSGYILSKAALKRHETTPSITKYCRKDGEHEDVAMGLCMERLGVKFGKSLDPLGRSIFHCFNPLMHITGHYPAWYYKYDSNGAKKGIENISNYPVSFHYIDPDMMYQMEFFIYHLRLYTRNSDNVKLISPRNLK